MKKESIIEFIFGTPGLSWAPLGAFLAALGALLGRSWPLLGCSWALLGRPGLLLGRSWVAFGPLLGGLGRSWGDLGTTCKNHQKNDAKNDRFWLPKGRPKGAKIGPKTNQNR